MSEGNALPSGWVYSELEKLFSFVLGGDWGKAPDYEDDNFSSVLCIRGSEFKNWNKNFGNTAVPRKVKKTSLEKRRLLENDILVEISGGGPEQPVGRTVLISKKCVNDLNPMVCTNFLRMVRPYQCLSSKYINYYLQFFYNSGEVVNYQGGSNNLRNLKFKDYLTIEVPLPPLNEQKRIADKLDILLAKVDAVNARLDSIPTLLKRFRQSVLAAATSGELSSDFKPNLFEAPLNELSQFCSIDIGHAFKSKKYTDSGIPLLRGQNIEPGSLRWIDTKYYKEDMLENYKHLYIRENDILLAMDRPLISTGLKLAKAKKSDLPCVLVQRVARFKDFINLLPDYLYLLLGDINFSNYLNPKQTGSNIPHISGKQILNYKVALPHVEEQAEIVRRVETLFALADHVEKQYTAAKARTDKLTQALLAKAFRGELVPQDPADEPASELLARIQAEREALAKAEKQRKAAARAAKKKKA